MVSSVSGLQWVTDEAAMESEVETNTPTPLAASDTEPIQILPSAESILTKMPISGRDTETEIQSLIASPQGVKT